MGWDDEKRASRAYKEKKALERKAKRHGGELSPRELARLREVDGRARKQIYSYEENDD